MFNEFIELIYCSNKIIDDLHNTTILITLVSLSLNPTSKMHCFTYYTLAKFTGFYHAHSKALLLALYNLFISILANKGYGTA